MKPRARDFEAGEFMWIVVNTFIPLHPIVFKLLTLTEEPEGVTSQLLVSQLVFLSCLQRVE